MSDVKRVKPAADLTDDEILESTKYALDCPGCGHPKLLGEPFCTLCNVRLPYGIKQSLHRAYTNGFEKAFRNAIENLRQVGVRNPYERSDAITDAAAG